MLYPDASIGLPHRPTLWGRRILIVDPDLQTAHFLLFQLEAEGAEGISVATLEQAIAIGAEWQPDTLITKLALPDGDSHCILDRLNSVAQQQGNGLLSIALTPFPHRIQSNRSLIEGFQYYLFDQVDRLTLLTSIQRLVYTRGATQHPQRSPKAEPSFAKVMSLRG